MTKSLKEVAKKMKDIDICMFTTTTGRGLLSSRPMSNNREVEYDGNSYYFTSQDSRIVKDITDHPQVALGFQGEKGLYISIGGKASLLHDKATMARHWNDSLNMWFKEGIDTPGIVLIHVTGNYIKYWNKEDEGEVKL